MSADFSIFDYSVPSEWYDGLYADRQTCCSASRSFSLVHKVNTDECWLFIHGHRGCPGELIRPAVDLYEAGFDVFVPRLPGHGTSWKDFSRTHSHDWMGLVLNALKDLEGRYGKVHLLGHSMGTAMAAIIGAGDSSIGRIVYACPSFENTQMTLPARIALRVLSPFTPKINCHWHPSSRYHLHFENPQEDYMFLGKEYWTWFFTKQLADYYSLLKKGLAALPHNSHEHLVICPAKDTRISMPSLELYRNAVKGRDSSIIIENGTHCIFYDKDPAAEEEAVRAVVEFACRK